MDPVHIGSYRNTVKVFHLAAENGALKPGVDGGNYQLFIEKLSENFNHSISHGGGLFEFPSGIFAVGGGCGAERLAEVYYPLAKLVTLVILIASYREAELGAVTLSALWVTAQFLTRRTVGVDRKAGPVSTEAGLLFSVAFP